MFCVLCDCKITQKHEMDIGTQYGSTVYIGIAMVFVFSPYVYKEIQFLFLVLTSDDFTA